MRPARWSVLRVLVACFLLGITSLLMELSLLREFIFVMGSTSSASSFVISLFLVGLAIGAYVGHVLGGRAPARGPAAIGIAYGLVQGANVALILVFVLTKNAIVYMWDPRELVYAYFGLFAVTPAVASGVSFSLFVAALYGHGRRYIAHIYSLSTMGNVVGGLLHGFVLVPYFGMKPIYVLAVATALASVALMVPTLCAVAVAAAGSLVAALVLPASTWPTLRARTLLYEKDDPNGVVRAFRADEALGQHEKDRIVVDVGGLFSFNCSNFAFDLAWKDRSAKTSLAALARPAPSFLLLGFCSGESVRAILREDPAATVDVMEMNPAVLDMARTLFQDNYSFATSQPHVSIFVDEFRSRLRFSPASTKYSAVMVDVTIVEPQSHGIFTREFFQAIRAHLSDDGVVFSHWPAYSRTAAEVFPYVYALSKPDGPYLEFQQYYAARPIPAALQEAAGLAPAPPSPNDPIYEDHGPLL